MSKGFTLIELLVVITIIAILSAIGMAGYHIVQKNARDSKRQADLKLIQSALQQYQSDQFFYPSGSLPFGSPLTSSIGNPSPPANEKTYLNIIPKDPSGPQRIYCYRAVPYSPACDNTANNKCTNYELYAMLENPPSGSPSYNNVGCSGTFNLKVTPP